MKLMESREESNFLYSVLSAPLLDDRVIINVVGPSSIEEDNGRLAQLV
jgi:hypothetical protein